jgi:hypothetical protein
VLVKGAGLVVLANGHGDELTPFWPAIKRSDLSISNHRNFGDFHSGWLLGTTDAMQRRKIW